MGIKEKCKNHKKLHQSYSKISVHLKRDLFQAVLYLGPKFFQHHYDVWKQQICYVNYPTFNNTKKQRAPEILDKNHVHYKNGQLLREEWCSPGTCLGFPQHAEQLGQGIKQLYVYHWVNISWPGA